MTFPRIILITLTFCTLAGCAAAPQSRATAAQQAACRQRADQAFNRQNPGEQYRADYYVSSQRDTPFGGTGSVGDPMAELGARYALGKLLDNCLRNAVSQPAPKP